eukprot:gene4942-8722_t
MASKTSTMGTTLRVLETLVKRWPSAGGKDGRSLAERLTSAYLARMNEGFSKDTESAWTIKKEIQAIEELINDQYRTEFPRKQNTNFSGSIGQRWGFSQLSSEAQSQFNKDGFFARMLKLKRPATES